MALGAVARRHVADLVGQHAGELGLVLGQGKQAAADIDVAPRQGEGIDDLRVEHGEGEGPIRRLRGLGQQPADRGHVVLQFGVVVGAAELLQHNGMLFGAQPGLGLRAQAPGEEGPARARRRLAGAQQGRGEHHEERLDSTADGHSSTSICSGCVASIIGPLKDFSQPLTRMRRPSKPRGSIPSASKRRRISGARLTVKSWRQSSAKFR